MFTDDCYKLLKLLAGGFFIAILSIQNIFRQHTSSFNSDTNHWFGILPNFFAGLGFCITLYTVHLAKIKWIKLNEKQAFIASMLIPLIVLIIWELLDTLVKHPFDFEDIYMSIAGTIIGGILILLFKNEKSIYGEQC